MASSPPLSHSSSPSLRIEDSSPLPFFSQDDSQSLFSDECYTGRHKIQNRRNRTPDGALCITTRHPSWTLPPLPSDIHLSSHSPLESMADRTACPICTKSRHYYCYDCIQPLTPIEVTPRLKLPFQVDIILHSAERRSMSTGIHVALLAPDFVKIHDCDGLIPSFDPSTCLLLFPSPDSSSPSDIDLTRINRVVVVESKWTGFNKILSLPQLQGLQHVRLDAGKTAFWRYHTRGVSDNALSTVEAVRALSQEWHFTMHGAREKCHCFDDLLWYFSFLHNLIVNYSID